MNYHKHTIKRAMLATAVTAALGAASLHAGPMQPGASFTMYDSTGGLVGLDTAVTGSIGDGSWSVSSTNTFFGGLWTAHNGTTFGPGTYTIDTIEGGVYTGIVVGAGQVGGHILFNWGVVADIDVINVWDEDCVPQATLLECTYTSTDVTAGPGTGPNTPIVAPNGILGLGMIDGGFVGFEANFDFVANFPLPGAPTFTPPTDVDDTNTTVTATPAMVDVPLGTVTDEDPADSTVDYSIDGLPLADMGKTWIPDNGTDNIFIDFPLTETINDRVVDWRAVNIGGTTTDTQNVRVTIDDLVAPVIITFPSDAVVDVATNTETVCFAGSGTPWGMLTAEDAIEPNLAIEWSLDGFGFVEADPVLNCSDEFGPNENTVYWQVRDKAVPDNNITTREQMVTLNLPTGIVGTDCVFNIPTPEERAICEADLDDPDCPVDSLDEFERDIVARFIMFDSTGAQAGTTDTTVTGRMDTTLLCTDEETCTLDSAAWGTTQPFFGDLWFATPVRLFGENVPEPSWTFEACPGNDNSINCTDPAPPRLLSMTSVGPDQLSAHMLFEWGVVKDIDVVVVWDIDCGEFQFTMTDPDGDGILGTRMVDGPFQGFSANYDISTAKGEIPFAEGGFTTTIPAFKNPTSGGSPLEMDNVELDETDLPDDPRAKNGCVGGCNHFVDVPTSVDATDGDGDYKQAYVVLPLRGGAVLPFWSKYRKFKGGVWQDFEINGRNTVESAPLNEDGSCPEPGSGDYSVAPANSQMENKLRAGDACIQLCIEDNGPNDTDMTPGIVADDSGAAQVASPPQPSPSTSGDGCSLSTTTIDPAKRADWTLMGGLLTVLGFFSLRRRRKQKH